jgi:7-cyano-7-deazaguanine reductase
MKPSMTSWDLSPLGKATAYPDRYDSSVLFAVARAPQRSQLGMQDDLPFSGCDVWNAYELTWLDSRRRPRIGIGEFCVPAESPAMVESKSLKLYLGSFAQEPLASEDVLRAMIAADLTRVCGAAVTVSVTSGASDDATASVRAKSLETESIDDCDAGVDEGGPDPTMLKREGSAAEESLSSALFRSLCPVTGQPDYADVFVRYCGPRIERAGLLRYLISYRRHAAFHEACVERIFVDILDRCHPEKLSVYARFMRRGGIDINPFRSNFEAAPQHNIRTARQ